MAQNDDVLDRLTNVGGRAVLHDVPGLPKNTEDVTPPRASNNGVWAAARYHNYVSSRETSPTADGSYVSAPSSITSVSSSIHLHVESGEDGRICIGGSSYAPSLVEGMADDSPLGRVRCAHEQQKYIPGVSNSINRDTKDQDSHTSQARPDVEDTDEEPESMDEYEDESEDGENGYNDWSGEDGGLEALVISAVEGDLGSAASLIPVLHKYVISRLRSKVESWQNCTTEGSHDSGGNGNSGVSSGTGQQDSPPRSHKRRRLGSGNSNNPEEGGDEDNDGEGHERPADNAASPDGVQQPKLACPFHKNNPTKYSVTDKKYRSCAGPGFQNIQRLREHLKRTHSPVQCDRCYIIFQSTERNKADALESLARHRQNDVACRRGDPSLKEGISEAQWATLDAQNRKTNKKQEFHRTQKWAAIWNVLFPDKEAPTPWYENIITDTFSKRHVPATELIEEFINMCMIIINTRARDLVFEEGQLTTNSEEILRRLLRQACNVWVALGRQVPGSQASSSLASSRHSSSIAHSSTTNLTAPTAGTSGPHGLVETSESNVQSALGSCNTDMSQTELMDTSPLNTELANMVITSSGLQHFQQLIPTTLPSGPSAGTPMSMRNYLYETQWPMQPTANFLGSDDMGTGPMGAFHEQPWNPSHAQYAHFSQGLPGNESGSYQQVQNFGHGANMDEDPRNSQ